MERRSKRPLLGRQSARHRCGGVGSGCTAADALYDAPGRGIRAAAMVKRFVSIVFLAAVTTAAAIGAHHFAVIEVHWDAPVGGIAAGLIASVMFLFLLVLALRYLLMLGLAAYAQVQPAPTPWSGSEGEAPFVSIIVPAFNEAPMIRSVL